MHELYNGYSYSLIKFRKNNTVRCRKSNQALSAGFRLLYHNTVADNNTVEKQNPLASQLDRVRRM